MLTVGSLFSGIGGIDLGLQRSGMVIRYQVEIDPYCQRVLAKHWPNVPRYGDIREVSGEELEHVDVIAGGFPCQPVSAAGKHLGRQDPRWLWPECARILRVTRPRFVLLENTPGLVSCGLGDVLGDLADLGFDAEWSLLSACTVGASHTRERLFVVAHSDRLNGEARLGPLDDWARSLPEVRDGARAWSDSISRSLEESRSDGRENDGISRRMVTSLGNAVVPQCAQFIGQRIVAADRRARSAATVATARETARRDPQAVVEYLMREKWGRG